VKKTKGSNIQTITEILGDEFLPELAKVELYKPQTNSTVDHSEMADALKIVPKAVMVWLTRCLSDMKEGENKNIQLPFKRAEEVTMQVTKITNDVYHGELYKKSNVLYRFKYRTIPGIGLILLTTFELYDLDKLDEKEPEMPDNKMQYLTSLIEEKIALRHLIGQVVEEKLSQRDAIDQLIKLRMTSEMRKENLDQPASASEEKSSYANSAKLKDFLSKRKIEKKDTYQISLMKSENIKCPDCRTTIFDGSKISSCLCYGTDMGRKVFFKKNENGSTTVKFSKGWDVENIQMLMEALKRRNK